MPADDRQRRRGAIGWDRHDVVDVVQLADADDRLPVRRETCVRVAGAILSGNRPVVTVQALIGEIREVHDTVVHDVGAATVLVHTRADVEPSRRDALAVTDQHVTAALPSSQYSSAPSTYSASKLRRPPATNAALTGERQEPWAAIVMFLSHHS